MTFEADSARPPWIAAWLVNLFAPADESESIVGDLLEEFSEVASKAGVASARRWYWRQALRTIGHLAGGAFRSAPWTIAAVVIGGFLLRWLVSWWSNPFVHKAIESVLDRYPGYERDPHVYIMWLVNCTMLEHLVLNTLVGGLVALAAKRYELTATVALAFVSAALAVQATATTLATTGDRGILGTLPWSFAFSIAVVVGGVLVRTRRRATS